MKWEHLPGDKRQSALHVSGHYVISHHYVLSYRPPGKHCPLGHYETLDAAKEAAEAHSKTV